jgi:hypothetical protein
VLGSRPAEFSTRRLEGTRDSHTFEGLDAAVTQLDPLAPLSR